MRVNFKTNVPTLEKSSIVKVGNVYSSKGGVGNTKVWVVISLDSEMCCLLGVAEDGNIVGVSRSGQHHWARRALIGFCKEVSKIELGIEEIER